MVPLPQHQPHAAACLVVTAVVLAAVGLAAAVALAPTPPADRKPQLRIPERTPPRLVTFPTTPDTRR